MTIDEIKSLPFDIEQSFYDVGAYGCALRALEIYHDGVCGQSDEYPAESCGAAVSMVSAFFRQSILNLEFNLQSFQKYFDYSLKDSVVDSLPADSQVER